MYLVLAATEVGRTTGDALVEVAGIAAVCFFIWLMFR